MKIIKRLKRLWKLTKKDKKLLDALDDLTDKEIMELPDEDTKGTFFPQGTEKDYEEFLKEENGLKPWYDKIRNL